MNQNIQPYLKKMMDILGGLRISFVLLLLLGGFAVLRAIVDHKAVALEETPAFLKILYPLVPHSPQSLAAPLFLVLALFVLNLCISSFKMGRRMMFRQRAGRDFKAFDALSNMQNFAAFAAPAVSEASVCNYFKQKGYKVAVQQVGPETHIRAARHGLGLWGAFFFHIALMVLLAGILLSILTKYTGYAEIALGEEFYEERESYRFATAPSFLFGDERQFKLRLDEIDLSYYQPGAVKQRANIVSLFDSEGDYLGRERMEINRPIHIDGMNVYQGTKQGFFAGLEVIDGKGDKISGTAQFRLPEKAGDRMTDTVSLGNTGINLDLELFTEKLAEIKGLESLSATHKATLLEVTVFEKGKRVSRGSIPLGSSLSTDGLTLYFINLRPYSSFIVTRDYGVPVIFASFGILLVGLLVVYFWVPERFWLAIRQEDSGYTIAVGAITERYKESFKEGFAEEVTELQRAVTAL
jgi:cytochrome c biogenesis protein